MALFSGCRFSWIVVAFLGFLGIPLAQHVRAGLANAECQPGRANDGITYHSFFESQVNGPKNAVTSKIKVLDTWVQSGSNVSAWTMLWNGQPEPDWRWAQVGWIEKSGNDYERFAQWTKDDGSAVTVSENANHLNTTPAYKTDFVGLTPSSGQYVFYIDGVEFARTGNLNWLPVLATISGETHTFSSQMPGEVSPRMTLRNSHARVGETWYAFASDEGHISPPGTDPVFGHNKVDPLSYEVWDTACP